jgi:uncharacterized membrane-anchored protein YhcB (DUF1043 family)
MLCLVLIGVVVLGVLSWRLSRDMVSVEQSVNHGLQDTNKTLDQIEVAICQKYWGWSSTDSSIKIPEWCSR